MDALQRALHLGRAVNFDCTLTLDQLLDVPLLCGKFKLKWKFEHPITTVHIEAQLKAKHVATTISHRLTISDDEAHLIVTSPPLSEKRPSRIQSSTDSHHDVDSAGYGQRQPSVTMGRARSMTESTYLPNPNSLSAPQSHPAYRTDYPPSHLAQTHSSNVAPNVTLAFTNPSFNPEDPAKHHNSPTPRPGYSMTSFNPVIEQPTRAESAGSTPYIEVKNHAVVFRQAFRCPVSIVIDKEGNLQPSLLTMVIKQEHVREDGKRGVSRHGSLTIDLSRFAPQHHTHGEENELKDKISRVEKGKFLLQDCKTNASLKLQIQMDYINGAASFRIPNPVPTVSPSICFNSPHDETKSVSSNRKSSPNSSIVSSSSSSRQKNLLTSSNKRIQVSPSLYTAASGGTARSMRLSHQREATLQVADELIDALFSSAYVPSSGTVSQRLPSAKPKISKQDRTGKKQLDLGISGDRTKPSAMSLWERSNFLKPTKKGGDVDDDKASTKSGKSFRSKFRGFGRGRMTAL